MRVESEKMFLIAGEMVKPFSPITFNASANLQAWQVPVGVKQIHVDCVASQGGNGGGLGGRVQCNLAVTSGTTLQIMVGAVPTSVNASYNASDIRIGGTEYGNRVVVAGGGGSSGTGTNKTTPGKGGAGGGTTGGTGGTGSGTGGGGGTQTAGGVGGGHIDSGSGSKYLGTAGSLGLGGVGAQAAGVAARGGAGGAGYYGGGGGCANKGMMSKTYASGGGGGSSYTHPTLCTNVVHTQGYRSGAGYITISMVE